MFSYTFFFSRAFTWLAKSPIITYLRSLIIKRRQLQRCHVKFFLHINKALFLHPQKWIIAVRVIYVC